MNGLIQFLALAILAAAPITIAGQLHTIFRLPWKIPDMALSLGIFLATNWLLAKYAIPFIIKKTTHGESYDHE